MQASPVLNCQFKGETMEVGIRSRIVPVITLTVFLLIAVLSFMFLSNSGVQTLETDVLSWADAAEKCKRKYTSLYSPGSVKIPNCKKRLEDDDYFYFYWRKPLAIFIKNAAGEQNPYPGTCQVSRTTGDIVHMTLSKKVLSGEEKK